MDEPLDFGRSEGDGREFKSHDIHNNGLTATWEGGKYHRHCHSAVINISKCYLSLFSSIMKLQKRNGGSVRVITTIFSLTTFN